MPVLHDVAVGASLHARDSFDQSPAVEYEGRTDTETEDDKQAADDDI